MQWINQLKPNYSMRNKVLIHRFYLPKVILQVQAWRISQNFKKFNQFIPKFDSPTAHICYTKASLTAKLLLLQLDTVQDFLIKLGIKLRMHPLEINILSRNVILRPTKFMKRADKNSTHFYETKYFINQSFQKKLLKVDLLVK